MTDKCKRGGCSAIGCEGGHYCFDENGVARPKADPNAVARALFPYLADDAQPVAIYQARYYGSSNWGDVDEKAYKLALADEDMRARIVYATRDVAPSDAQDAERYRYARDNIMEGYELPNGFYLSDARSASWDETIDAAIAASAQRDK